MENPPNVRVLLVEDSEDDAELIKIELWRAGLEVECRRVESEDHFRAALADGPWDIVISDYAMPNFNGMEAFRLLKSLDVDVPFLFVSAALGEERAVEAMRIGARDYILKSNLTRLAEAVRRELEDLSNRRRQRLAEDRARREARRLAVAVEASGAGIYEHRVPPAADSHHSDRWAEILGFSREELPPPEDVRRWFDRRIHPEDQAEVLSAYADFLSGKKEKFACETRVAHKHGHWVSVALFGKPIKRDASGRAIQVVGVMLDIGQRRQLEDQLRQSQKMEAVGRLAGGVAHDFNNLLTVIYTFGGFVLRSLPKESRTASDMAEVLKAAERAASLTSQLLAFSRSQPIQPKVVDLNELVRGTEKILQRILGEGVEVVTELQHELGLVRVDPSAFEQVLFNLAINAHDAMPTGGKLTIETCDVEIDEPPEIASDGSEVRRGRYVGVTVSDDGHGMSDETLAQIFEPFFTTKEPGKGTGLGLSICHGIIKRAGGHIRVRSEPGSGTTFGLLLPRVLRAEEAIEAPLVATNIAGTETVLVAEDDEQVRRLTARVLSQEGYRVFEAGNGEQALATVREIAEPIHLLVTDVVMPVLGGTQLATELLALRPDMKVLYISGYSPDSTARGAFAPEAALVQKPFTPEHLLQKVRDLLDGD